MDALKIKNAVSGHRRAQICLSDPIVNVMLAPVLVYSSQAGCALARVASFPTLSLPRPILFSSFTILLSHVFGLSIRRYCFVTH